MATNCVYRSITLHAGESIVLPQGAEVVSATDTGAITSSCGDLNLEQMACYGFILMAANNEHNNVTEVYEFPRMTFSGVYLNNIYYAFATEAGWSGAAITARLQALPFGGAFTNICTSGSDDLSRDSMKGYVVFKTLPSIAATLELKALTPSPNNGSGVPSNEFRIPCITRAGIIASGNDLVCDPGECDTP